MPEYRIRIKTDNAAFFAISSGEPGPECCGEIARILRKLATSIEEGGTGHPAEGINLRDINGNQVGVANWK